jgi:plastocyanin
MKRWLIALLVLTVAVGSLALVASAAQKTKMVMLTASGISPKTATVEKGTTVIWVNNSNGSLGLFFSQGKEVEAVCAAPSRFRLDAEGKYNAESIPQGGTASVCFLEAGKYEYDVVVQEKKTGGNAKGTIIVK